MNIRTMQVGDVVEVIRLGRGQKEFATETLVFWSEEQLKRWCESSADIALVAEEGNKIIGFSLYAAHVPTGKVTWENLYVDPEARGKGVGAALIQEGLKRSKEKGYVFMVLQDNNENQEKFAKYLEQFGFVKGHSMLWIDQILK